MDADREKIEKILRDSIKVKQEIIAGSLDIIEKIAREICVCLTGGGKLIVFGNGGSAADAQHLVAELVGRFQKERPALPAISLSTNTSTITALGNDYGYDMVFMRQIQALADKKDMALAISTSGKSGNVIRAVLQAKSQGIKTIAFTGGNGGELAKIADIVFIVPSQVTARIQEAHITVGHIICELVEDAI